MATPFRYRRRVQFAETDAAGLTHFSCYFKFMEEAEHALWREAGMSIWAPASGVGFPRVSATCEFLAPLHFEDEFVVLVRIETMARRSIRYACEIVRGDTRIATGSMTAVCVSKGTDVMRAVEIPAEIVQRLTAMSEQ
jgi:acyl-CoA thioester hydrolase